MTDYQNQFLHVGLLYFIVDSSTWTRVIEEYNKSTII